MGTDRNVSLRGTIACDECGAPAQTLHVLPSGEQPERLALACANHDPGGEWWDLTELDDLGRALQNASAFDELRPDVVEALRTLHREAATSIVEIPCIVCRTITALPAAATELLCGPCGALYTFRACAECGAVEQVGPKAADHGPWRCTFCLSRNINVERRTPALSARARFDELGRHGMTPLGPDVSLVTGFTHFGGVRFPIVPGSLCSVVASGDAVVVTAERSDEQRCAVVVRYADLTALEIEGGAYKTGGGFIGGGFGFGGAVEGMMVASVLNALTRRTKINTAMRIGSRQGELLLHHGKKTPAAIERDLSLLFAGYHKAKNAEPAETPQTDPLAQLERLAKLREVGALTEEEFQAARAQYVRQLTDRS
jgi:hypothetical protein